MAGDWIKMRVWLRKDPKVASIADYLSCDRDFMNWLTNPVQQHCKESAYEHITSDITRAITVGSLLEVWGVARDRGVRIGDDLLLKHCDIGNLAVICGTPTFGEAMQHVGWAAQTTQKNAQDDDVYCVVFPNFFKEHDAPGDRFRKQHAQAQARYRDKKRDITSDNHGDVTVTLEKSREEKSNNNTPTPLLKKSKFVPPTVAEVEAYCRSRANVVDAQQFVDYYESKGWLVGKSPMKRWQAAIGTWERNGVGRAAANGANHGGPLPPTAVEIAHGVYNPHTGEIE